MDALKTILKKRPWRGRPKLEALPFEELQNRFTEENSCELYGEFIRRMHRLMFYAAKNYIERTNGSATQTNIEGVVMRMFEEFGPQFGNGEPITLLLRFAGVIRRILDDKAFKYIAEFYYRLLPVYHIADDQERRFLGGAFQAALAGDIERDIDEVLAERFETTVADAGSILTRARKHLDDVIRSEFEAEELQDCTEGYLP